MKKYLYFLFFIMLSLLLAACGGKPGTETSKEAQQAKQEQQAIKLKMADVFPIGHTAHAEAQEFAKRIEEETGGKVKIEYYPAEQLGKLKDMMNLCSQGIADIAYVPPSFFVGNVPLNSVIILPFYTTAVEGTEIFNRLYKVCPELTQEYLKYGVRPLQVNATCQYDIGTVKKPIKSPDDLKGLRLKTSGGIFDRIALQYGVVSVTVSAPEIYESMQRGIVEGAIFSFPAAAGYRLEELEKYHTYGLRMGGYATVYCINEKVWQQLTEDVRKGLQRAAEKSAVAHGENWDRQTEKLVKDFEKKGVVINRIKPEDRAKWQEPLRGIEEIWVQDMEKKGLPGRKVFEQFEKISKEVASKTSG